MDQPLFYLSGSRVLKFCKKRPIPSTVSIKLLTSAKKKKKMSLILF